MPPAQGVQEWPGQEEPYTAVELGDCCGAVLLGNGRHLCSRILLRVADNGSRWIVLRVSVNSLLLIAVPLLRITISLLRIASRVSLGTGRRIGDLLLSGRSRLLVELLGRPLSAPPHFGVVVLLRRSVAATPETQPAGTQNRV